MASDTEKRIAELEAAMADPQFWADKDKAQSLIKEHQELKAQAAGEGKYEQLSAIVSILSGAGGDDAEDFSRMLLGMYQRYSESLGWSVNILHENQNDHGGYRNITFEIAGKGVYGVLQNESGVHRLVRISPFNAKQQRHTSFSLVEVIPKLEKMGDIEFSEDELEIQYARSSGPGGQNVNKRETAVRVTHIPTNISVHVETERSQAQNKERAIEIVRGKLYKKREEDRRREARGLSISATTSIEWGNQIRSYVLHPYKMVKDHRTDAETSNVEAVLDGDIQFFIDAERGLE